jgi:hypothetical protein
MSDTGSSNGDDGVPFLMSFTLVLCYEAIFAFDELPLRPQTLIDAKDAFLDANARHAPPIETLQDFVDHYADVAAMFEGCVAAAVAAYDADRQQGRTTQTFRARLGAMRATIERLGAGVVDQKVHELWDAYCAAHLRVQADRAPAVFETLLRVFLCAAPRGTRRAGVAPPGPARSHARLTALLRRLRLCGMYGMPEGCEKNSRAY